MSKPKVLVCVLCGPERNQWISPGLSQRLLEAQRSENVRVEVEHAYGIQPVVAARNWCCKKAVESGADYLCMVDCDELPPLHFVDKVIADIHKRPEISVAVLPSWCVVGDGVVTLNIVQHDTGAAYAMPDRMQPGWREIHTGGSGVIFVRKRVLESMEQPWFRFDAKALLAMQTGGPAGPCEDFEFIIRARDKHRFRTFANSEYTCDHLHTLSMAAIVRSKERSVRAVQQGKFITVGTIADGMHAKQVEKTLDNAEMLSHAALGGYVAKHMLNNSDDRPKQSYLRKVLSWIQVRAFIVRHHREHSRNSGRKGVAVLMNKLAGR
jgi:hypothetical protein